MKITLHYIFSRKEKWGSKLISWASNKITPIENCPSHVALLVNNKWVFESTLDKNVRVISYKKWKKINIETHKLKCSQERTFQELKNVLKPLKGKKYDWLGIIYFSYRILLNFLFQVKIPKHNKLEQKNAYFCCEAVGELTKTDYSMTTPAQLYLNLKSQLEENYE